MQPNTANLPNFARRLEKSDSSAMCVGRCTTRNKLNKGRVPVLVTNNGARGRMNFQKTAGRSGRETKYLQAAALLCHCLSVPRPISPRRLSVLSSQPQSYCNHVTYKFYSMDWRHFAIFGLRNERPAPRYPVFKIQTIF